MITREEARVVTEINLDKEIARQEAQLKENIAKAMAKDELRVRMEDCLGQAIASRAAEGYNSLRVDIHDSVYLRSTLCDCFYINSRKWCEDVRYEVCNNHDTWFSVDGVNNYTNYVCHMIMDILDANGYTFKDYSVYDGYYSKGYIEIFW